MPGAPKRQVNAEEMLAELKRVLESSARAPDAPPPSASAVPKSCSPGRVGWRSQIDKGSDWPVNPNAVSSVEPATARQKLTRPSFRSWKLAAAGLALAGVAAVFASLALMSKAPNLPTHQLAADAKEGLVRPQDEPILKPSTDSGPLMEDSRPLAPLQAGALETRPDAGAAPANSASAPAQVDASHPASSGAESAPPAFVLAPPNLGAVPVPTQMIGPDGAPIATAPPTPASSDSAPLAETPKTAAPPAASQGIRPDGAPIATAPPTTASSDSAPLAETPKTAAPPAASQEGIRPDGAPVTAAPPTPASNDSAPLAQTPKPKATPAASMSNDSAAPSTREIDSRKKPPGRPSLQKPHQSAKTAAKAVAQPERREPAPPKEAERSPEPAQGAVNPTALAPVAVPTVQQRFADGMTHAFGYLVHLPGALVQHLGGPNADAH